jgi:hypothetical protein
MMPSVDILFRIKNVFIGANGMCGANIEEDELYD